jgi:hypothetical protein
MIKQLSWKAILAWVTIYSIAMGFLECAVVVYLRTIYYPYGFDFPLSPIDKPVAIVEIGREAATLFMLLSIGIIAGRTRIQRFAYFIYSFAIWDIFYYVFLYVLIGWPQSLLTWDILFLIPVTWVSPVIAPVILSFTMILLALMIIFREAKGHIIKMGALAWLLLVVGSLILILAFIWDYSSFLLEKFPLQEILHSRTNEAIYEYGFRFIPGKFNWLLFIAGEVVILLGIFKGIIVRKKKPEEESLSV